MLAASRCLTNCWSDIPKQSRLNSGTAKGGLAHLLAKSTSSSRAPSDAGDIIAERADEVKKNHSRKKKPNKKNKGQTSKPGAVVSTAGLEKPAFLLPPRALKPSASYSSLRDDIAVIQPDPDRLDQDHSWSFVKRQPVSSRNSASSSPPHSGLSSLLSQAHPGDRLTFQTDSETSASESGEQPLVTYEVAIDEDYVSRDVASRAASRGVSPTRNVTKKMTSEDFEPLKCLGKGSFGTVLLVRHKSTGRLYAQKRFKKASIIVHKEVIEQTKTERAILESVSHPFVVKLFYAFQDNDKLYLILEYAEGGELFHHLAEERMFCEDTASFYVAELVLALSHLHQNVGVVYRDLKPENCLLDVDGHLLLTDFGLSKVSSEDDRCSSMLGTPGYMAPEVLKGNGTVYGAEVDWWGVGILAFELLTGYLPFEGSTSEKVKAKIEKKKLQLPSYLSADAKDFITRLLRKEPHKRLGHDLAKDLPTIKKHRFFRKINWEKLEAREMIPPIQPLVTDPLLAENFSNEFTALPLSPTLDRALPVFFPDSVGYNNLDNIDDIDHHFQGFSFVATSLLEQEYMGGTRAW